MQLMEVSNKFNEHAQPYDGVMIDVPLFSWELLDKGNGAHASVSWMLETHVEILGNTDDGVELGRTRWR